MKKNLLLLSLCLAALLSTGCAGYWRDRAHDARNIIDLGISVNDTWKPQFALYCDFFNLTPIGYGKLDCKVFGMGSRQLGWMDYENESWGVLAYGHEKHGYGVFNPNDPQLTRPDQRDLTERPMFTVGGAGAFSGDQRPPKLQFLECDRSIHLGWIGFQNGMRPLGILDFILGWTTYDLLGDNDLAPPPAPAGN